MLYVLIPKRYKETEIKNLTHQLGTFISNNFGSYVKNFSPHNLHYNIDRGMWVI